MLSYSTSTEGTSIDIPHADLESYCEDGDGLIKMIVKNLNNDGWHRSFSYDFALNGNLFARNDDIHQNIADSVRSDFIHHYSCYLTDAKFTSYNEASPGDGNLRVLNWTAYSNETCTIVIVD